MTRIFIATLALSLATIGLAQDSGFQAGGFTFEYGDAWQPGKPSSRMASGAALHKAQELQAQVFHFGGPAGGVEANVNRWKGQFQGGPKEEKVEKREIGGIPAHFVTLDGVFMDGPPLGEKKPMADHTMLGAILEGAAGTVFVKLTGPKDKVAALRDDFDALVTGAAESGAKAKE